MAGNNRTVWNTELARGLARWLGGAFAVLALAWGPFALAQGAARLTAGRGAADAGFHPAGEVAH
jgi:hypothetical protein